MFDCAYEPEPIPGPAATSQKTETWPIVTVAALLVLGMALAAYLGNIAADLVLS